MKEFLLFLAGVIVSSIAYLIKRRLEKSSILEDLEIQLKLLEVNARMKEQNITEEELQNMRDRLPALKPSSSRIIEFAEALPEPRTQAEMNEYADKEYRTLEKELEITIKAIKSHRDSAWIKALDESHQAWLKYRNTQAQMASDQYKGGSIAPFIYITEATSITRNRITELRMLLAPANQRFKLTE